MRSLGQIRTHCMTQIFLRADVRSCYIHEPPNTTEGCHSAGLLLLPWHAEILLILEVASACKNTHPTNTPCAGPA